MQVLKKNVMIRNLYKTDSKMWDELIEKQLEIASKRYEYTTFTALYENILIPIEQNYHNLTDAGRDNICYSALEICRRVTNNAKTEESKLLKLREETVQKYNECLLYTGEHRELRTQKDKENYENQLKYKGQIELLDTLLDC